ncbi:unnamed protein product [Parnassius mnemosyne]|uniref:Myeloid differentiation primary response protein MyD88 n=1 Tax=Parnassius mnemosyne TaxID=213953 RepID=A0AAV1KIU3_9NEOP
MDNDINLLDIPLSWLTNESRNLLSYLLNTRKILPSDTPEKLPRDWRGLASLVNISTEIATSINEYPDKTAKVLEIWMKLNQNTAKVGYLMQFLQHLDRYDIYDDCIELYRQGKLIARPNENHGNPSLEAPEDDRLITYDDKLSGEPQFYHAYVLYAREDKEFVDELLRRMRADGLKLCTEDDLLPGHATQYAPVSRLISERCQRIILVYSPEFLNSPANSFYTDYAQAVGIEKKQLKIIPLMYRDCQLPMQLTYYHKLYYSPPGHKAPYDFWQKLSHSLQLTNLPRLNSTSSNHSTVNISEVSSNSMFESRQNLNGYTPNKPPYLELPSIPTTKSISMSDLDSCEIKKIPLDDSKSLSNVSQISTGKQKKPSKIRSFINTLRKKKPKKAIMVEA